MAQCHHCISRTYAAQILAEWMGIRAYLIYKMILIIWDHFGTLGPCKCHT